MRQTFKFICHLVPNRTVNERSVFSSAASSMASSKSSIVFDDIFEIDEIDKAGKKFDRGMFL